MWDFVGVHVENDPSGSGTRACLALNIVKPVRIVQAQTENTCIMRSLPMCWRPLDNFLKPSAIPVVCPPLWDHSKDHSRWHHTDSTARQPAATPFWNHICTRWVSKEGGWGLQGVTSSCRSKCHLTPVAYYVAYYINQERGCINPMKRWRSRSSVKEVDIALSVFRLSTLHVNWDKEQIQMPKSNFEQLFLLCMLLLHPFMPGLFVNRCSPQLNWPSRDGTRVNDVTM